MSQMISQLGYYDPKLSRPPAPQTSLGDVDPYLLAAQGERIAVRIIENMTPAQAARLIERIEQSGLGDDMQLSGLLDFIKKAAKKVVSGVSKVATTAAPLLTAASTFVPFLAPVAGAAAVASGFATALTPAQVAQLQARTSTTPGIQTFRQESNLPSWAIPAAIVGGLLLLSRGR